MVGNYFVHLCMGKITGIYKITSPTGKIYIGQSVDIHRRFNYYKSSNCKKQKLLYNSLCKYGYNLHLFEIVKVCLKDELNKYEIEYINLYNSFSNKNGLNLRSGGNQNRLSQNSIDKIKIKRANQIITEETKNKIRQTLTGRKKNKDVVLKGVETRKKNKYVCSEETKLKISIANKNKLLGRKLSEETKLKIGNGNKGKSLTNKMKKDISKRMVGNKNPCKKIINIETQEVFSSVKLVAESLNISQCYLSQQLNGKRKKKQNLHIYEFKKTTY